MRGINTDSRTTTAVLTGIIAGLALCAMAFAVYPAPARAQSTRLLNRVLNQRIASFEKKLAGELERALSKYLSPAQYVLAVNVVWDPGSVTQPGEKQVEQQQHKLPGFPIFIHSQQCTISAGATTATVRLEIQALIDESLPSYYERFFRKVIPIIARMDFTRGDRLHVIKENFPVLAKFRQVPVLPEEELMKKAGQIPKPKGDSLSEMEQDNGPKKPGQEQFRDDAGRPDPFARAEADPRRRPPASPRTPLPSLNTDEAAQVAFDEGRLEDAKRILNKAFENAPNKRQRSKFLGMLGSIYYSSDDLEKARESWERAAALDPANTEVHLILKFLRNPPKSETK